MLSDGWWDQAIHAFSPNFNDRPEESDIDLLVIHNISLPPGVYGQGYSHDLFLNKLDCSLHPYFKSLENLQVSAHAFIERDGCITQFVSFDKRAWHAGRSVFDGRSECNDFSIGIELEGTDDDAYTDVQYRRLVELSAVIMNTYPKITLDRIAGHSDIAPERKTDPGPSFNWQFYKSLLAQNILKI